MLSHEIEYKETEIGLFPENWDIDFLGNIYEIQQGKALSQKHRQGKSPSIFLRTSNVYWGKLDLTTLDQMDFTDTEREKLHLKEGDLLICEGGEIGRTAIWNEEISDCYYQNHVFRVRPIKENVYSKFHMFWMDAAIRQLGHYRGYGNKTTIPNLSKRRLSSFPIPLPPFPEQRAIAHVLTTVHQAIEATERVIEAAQDLKRSMMKHLFTYGPVPVDQADKVPLNETEIGEVPEEWPLKPIRDITELSYGYRTSIPKQPPENGIEIISTADITFNGKLDLSKIRTIEMPSHLIDRYTVQEDDLLFNWRNAQKHVGKTAIMDFTPRRPTVFASFIIRIRTTKELKPRYMHQLLTYLRDRRIFFKLSRRAVNQANFNANELGELEITIPDLSIQERIVSILMAIDEKIDIEINQKKSLEKLFNSLLHQLMTGKIRMLV